MAQELPCHLRLHTGRLFTLQEAKKDALRKIFSPLGRMNSLVRLSSQHVFNLLTDLRWVADDVNTGSLKRRHLF